MSNTPNENERVRVQLDLSPEVVRALDDMKSASGCATHAEVLRKAISVLAVLVEDVKAGARIEVVERGGGRKQLVII
jgi:hypothetical protein